MNKLEIKKIKLSSGNENDVFMVDDIPLYHYMEKWISDNPKLKDSLLRVDELAVCWTNDMDFEGDIRFIKYVLSKHTAVTPILSCPDDMDFSCVVIVADVVEQGDKIIWKRIGRVDHSNESCFDEVRSGILCLETYTDEDWKLYGDNVGSSKVDSEEWLDWIGNNWSEELYRRRVNYTFPYYQEEKNICWFGDCNFVFDKKEYENLIQKCFSDEE